MGGHARDLDSRVWWYRDVGRMCGRFVEDERQIERAAL